MPAHNIGGELETLYRLTAHDRQGLNYIMSNRAGQRQAGGIRDVSAREMRAMTPNTITANYEHLFDLPGGGPPPARIDGEYPVGAPDCKLDRGLSRARFPTVRVRGRADIGNFSANWASSGGRYDSPRTCVTSPTGNISITPSRARRPTSTWDDRSADLRRAGRHTLHG